MAVAGVRKNNAAHLSKMGKAALAYAKKLNWAVLPLHSVKNGHCTCGRPDCPSPGKHPRTARGVHDATKNPTVIVQWWQKWPGANIGIRTGKDSGFFVVDVDGEEGVESLRELEKQYGELPTTPMQITGSGGLHILFKYPSDTEIRPKVRLMPGIDIRGENSYIVAAPSIHICGKRYCWELEHHPLEVPLAEAPEWVPELITEPIKREDTAPEDLMSNWIDVFMNLREGQRNTILYRYVCHLMARGISCREAFFLAHAVNRTYSKPPLPDSEVDNIVKSATRWRLRENGKRNITVFS